MRTDLGNNLTLGADIQQGSYGVDFVEMIIADDAVLRFSTLYRDVTFTTFDGNDTEFQAAGHLLNLSDIKDEIDVRQNSINISLSGLHPGLISEITRQDFFGSPINIYRGYWNEATGQLVDTPFLVWRGIANNYSTAFEGNLGQENSLTVTVVAKNLVVAILDTTNGRYTSVASFQSYDPTDRSMDYVANLTSFNPNFGREN